ncbi:MAG: zinc ribbon domain-containing protein [Haloarculaceae archaeon]
MSKITFRADDDLIEQLEEFDASKSEVMRDALREYLGESTGREQSADTLDGFVAERVDALVADRLEQSFTPRKPQDVNVNVTIETDATGAPSEAEAERKTESAERETPDENAENASDAGRKTCGQCGENLDASHVYCPNCGEKAARRVFCDCGDELRSDWAFCPSCGKRTPAADVLDGP